MKTTNGPNLWLPTVLFFCAALWATLSMAFSIAMQTASVQSPTAFDSVSWHAHESQFGYLTAAVAGFLLTAVPNWTGRPPIVGWWLGGLAVLWLAGRLAIAFSLHLPAVAVALLDLAMSAAFGAVIAREIFAGRNCRNLIVLAMLLALAVGNAVFYWEAAQGDHAARGYGLRIGLSPGLMMIAVIGGRIVPSFTRNWLVKGEAGNPPASPMQRLDKIALLLLLGALV